MTKITNPHQNKFENLAYNMVFTKVKTPAAFKAKSFWAAQAKCPTHKPSHSC